MLSSVLAKFAHFGFGLDVFVAPLIPISKELSQVGQVAEPVPPEASRVLSGRKIRMAFNPDPAAADVPPLVGESKLAEEACWKIILTARALVEEVDEFVEVSRVVGVGETKASGETTSFAV